MEINLSPETQKLVEERMHQFGYSTPDEAIRIALELMDQPMEADAETLAAIQEGEAQLDRGEGRPWEDVKAELKARFFPKK
jgi:Arc/MetJ-type ribon-helix-helix transcriptional regulator